MSDSAPRILVCRCSFRSDVISPQKRNWFDEHCADAAVLLVDDLCGVAAGKHECLRQFAESDNPVVVACHPRAVRALFCAAGCELPQKTQFINARTASLEEISAAVLPLLCGTACSENRLEAEQNWIPWFPVIDPQRCTNCGQCLNFCLFGTYAQDAEGKVVVDNPAACKTNCPACARICPSVAIMFPKYAESPIDGSIIVDEGEQMRRVKVDTGKILGSDVYGALRKRQQKRKLLSDTTRQQQMEKARLEREAWLRKQAEGDQ